MSSPQESEAKMQIDYLRLSFIWAETILDPLVDSDSSDAPLAFLGHHRSYIKYFDQLLPGGIGPGGLEMPWSTAAGHFFWTYYLEGCTPGYVSGEKAWKALVPLRKKIAVAVQAPWLPGRFLLESFFFPHGIAFVLTASSLIESTLEETVEKSFGIRRKGKLQVEWEKGSVDFLTLDALAEKVLAALRKAYLGANAAPSPHSATPFTILTIVRGTGIDPTVPTPNGGEIHRALEAVTTWRPTWRFDTLPNLDEAALPTRTAPPSHVLYARTRGRAIWFPGLFVQKSRSSHSLACYHRNLTFASLQVESLGDLIARSAGSIREGVGGLLPATHLECARRAAGILGQLYGGALSTYRSWSPRVQIDQNNLVADLNIVRDYFNMTLLS